MSNSILLIALAVVAVGLLITLIVVSVKLKQIMSINSKMCNEMKLKDLYIDGLNITIKIKDTTIKEWDVDIQSLEKDLSMAKNERDHANMRLQEELNLIRSISEAIPEKLTGKCDLTKRKDFVACWMRLQNEAFQSKALRIVDDKILLIIK